MPKATITIAVDPQTARAYDAVGPEEKRKIQALLSLWLRELASSKPPSLQEILDQVALKAESRGLTPEALENLLNGS